MTNDLWEGREGDEDDHIYKEKRMHSPQYESSNSSIIPILISFVFVITFLTILIYSIILNS